MNTRQIYLKTADYLEAHPDLYDFDTITVPPCGSPGCVIGIAAMIIGGMCDEVVGVVCPNIFGMDEPKLYYKMCRANNIMNDIWTTNANVAAKCLRLLANEIPDRNFSQEMEDMLSHHLKVHDQVERNKQLIGEM